MKDYKKNTDISGLIFIFVSSILILIISLLGLYDEFIVSDYLIEESVNFYYIGLFFSIPMIILSILEFIDLKKTNN